MSASVPFDTRSSQKLTFPVSNRSQYLWCVIHYGPNNQLKDFIKCAVLALINNYTLILPPLFPHYLNKHRDLQYFDHLYDLKRLKSVVHLITLDELVRTRSILNRSILVIDCYMEQIALVEARRQFAVNALNSIETLYNIKILFNRRQNLSRQLSLNEVSRKTKGCSSIFLHIHYTTFRHFFAPPQLYTRKIFEQLHRAPLIQRMAQQILQLLPHMIAKQKYKLDPEVVAVAHFRLGDLRVMNTPSYVKQIVTLIRRGVRFTHLHIMSSALNASEIDYARSQIPVSITTTNDLHQYAHWILDDYLFDILEQEIALRAPIFIGSPKSTYSATVTMQKVYQEQGQVYLFSLQSNKPPLKVTKANVRYFDY